MNSDEFEVSGKYFKYDKNALWQLLFYHNLTEGPFFSSKEEALHIENRTYGKYSILNLLNTQYKDNDKYEFLLEYPEMNKSNHWRQSKNPLHEREYNMNDTKKNATGYEEIDIQAPTVTWGGLVRSTSNNTLLDGSTYHSYWSFAIGALKGQEEGHIPGPNLTMNIVYLWVKYPTYLHFLSCQYKECYFHRLHVFIMIECLLK